MARPISDDVRIARNEWVLFSETGEGISLMELDSGNYYHFEKTGARIWELLDKPTTITELCDQLVAEYAVEPEACRSDVEQFIDELSTLRLVDLQDGTTQ